MDARRLGIALVAAAALLAPAGAAAAAGSWRLDAERYHLGAHGQLACAACHADAAARRPHPDPGAMTRRPTPAPALAACAACHERAAAEAADGSHGGRADSAERPLSRCTDCHDPHAGLASAAPAAAADPGLPPETKCRLCHALEPALPPPAPGEEACTACHFRPEPTGADAAARESALCFHCHAEEGGGPAGDFPRLDRAAYASAAHAAVACRACHPAADRTAGHGRQPRGECRACHPPHPAATANEVHLGVACGACHVPGALPFRERGGGGVGWRRAQASLPGPSAVHAFARPDRGESCRRCHAANNGLGAPAAVLPPKGVLCMPCHAATATAGDAVTRLALLAFALGALALGSTWVSGARRKPRHARGCRGRLAGALAGFFLDGLLQRRLYRHSRGRWALHALVFFPFLFRGAWGLAALAGSRLAPEAAWAWVMLDQNHPLTAWLFDASGLAILAGAAGMIVRRLTAPRLPGLPPADWPAHALMAALMLSGFVLEGVRIALAGHPAGSAFAFAGDAVARAFHGAAGLDRLHPMLWYAHAILTGAFVAYLPFSRMRHLLLAPIALALRPLSAHEPTNA